VSNQLWYNFVIQLEITISGLISLPITRKTLLTQNKVLSNIPLNAESFPATFLHFE